MVFQGEFIVMVSDLLEWELSRAPQEVYELFRSIPPELIRRVSVSRESDELAMKYIEAKVVGKNSFMDCRHLATASVSGADMVVSWNYKHMVNINRIRGYNSVNIVQGYSVIEIRSPKEIVNNDNDSNESGNG